MRSLTICSIITLCIAAACAEDPEKIPANPQKCEAGIETGKWKVEEWGNQGLAEMIFAGETRALKLTFSGGDKEKVAFLQQNTLSADVDGKVHLHVYSPAEKPPQVSVYLLVGPKADWHEAKPFTVKQGWNEFEVALTKPNWKTAGTKWAFTTGVEKAEDVRGIGLTVMNGKASGWVAIQGLGVDAGKASKEVEDLAKKMLSEDGEERAQAEKALAAIGRPAIPTLRKLKGHERPEVALRAGWALDKIEADSEKERRAEEAKDREGKAFRDAKGRAEVLVADLKGARAKLQQLASDAREELLRAQKTAKEMKAPSDDEQKAYEALLKQLDEVSRETLRLVGAPDAQTADGGEKKTE